MAEDADHAWGAKAIAVAGASSTAPSRDSQLWLKSATRWIPLLGRLWDCRPEHMREALYEVLCVLLFSTLPLWFFPIISAVLFTVELPFFSEAVSSGELLIYAASLSGTMVYFIAKTYGSIESRPESGEGPILAVSVSFPYGRFFIILSAFICMFAAAVFFMLKVAKYLLADKPNVIDVNGTNTTSWFLFLISVILFYCAVAFRNLLDDGRSYRNKPAESVLADWDEDK
jgi:hypothetical protein